MLAREYVNEKNFNYRSVIRVNVSGEMSNIGPRDGEMLHEESGDSLSIIQKYLDVCLKIRGVHAMRNCIARGGYEALWTHVREEGPILRFSIVQNRRLDVVAYQFVPLDRV